MRHGFSLFVALGALAAVGVTTLPGPTMAAESGVQAVRFDGGDRGHGFDGIRGGGFRGGYRGHGFYRRGYGYGPGFPGPAYYGLRRRRAWCYYHPGACYPFP